MIIILAVLSIAIVLNKPDQTKFPEACPSFSAETCSRQAALKSFRNSDISLVYPMTFKSRIQLISSIVYTHIIEA